VANVQRQTEPIDDWRLVEQARAGNMTSFAKLVRRYQTPVVHFCGRMLGSVEDAEEVAQECFVRVYRHLDRLRPDAKFSTALFGIARNLTLNAIRDANRRGRGRTVSMTQADQTVRLVRDDTHRPDRRARLQEMDGMIQQALETLSPDHREVLLLRELQGLDYGAIAAITKCRTGTVKSRIARAREQLRLRLLELGGDML
jgi:RNA polymerase sigma-70 factor, ECF subfamily